MEFKRREYLLAYAVAGLLGIWVVSKTVFTPFHAKLLNLRSEAVLEEVRLRKGVALVERKDEIDKEYGKYASYFSLQEYSGEEAVASFLRELEKISRETGLVISDIKPQKETKSDKFSKQYQINIRADADIKKLVTFLYALHDSSLLFSVEKLTLSPKAEDSPELAVVMTVAGVSFL